MGAFIEASNCEPTDFRGGVTHFLWDEYLSLSGMGKYEPETGFSCRGLFIELKPEYECRTV